MADHAPVVTPQLWSELRCPNCGCTLHSDGGFEKIQFAIVPMTRPCDQCGVIITVELAGPGPHYVFEDTREGGGV